MEELSNGQTATYLPFFPLLSVASKPFSCVDISGTVNTITPDGQ